MLGRSLAKAHHVVKRELLKLRETGRRDEGEQDSGRVNGAVGEREGPDIAEHPDDRKIYRRFVQSGSDTILRGDSADGQGADIVREVGVAKYKVHHVVPGRVEAFLFDKKGDIGKEMVVGANTPSDGDE